MFYSVSEKWEKRNNGRNGTAKLGKHQNAYRGGKLYLGILEAETIKRAWMKKKRKKENSCSEQESFLKPISVVEIASKEYTPDKNTLVTYSEPFLKPTKRNSDKWTGREENWG